MIQVKLRFINSILETKENVLGLIYKITNEVNNKCYIGQTVTHKLNSKKYRPFGEVRRLKQHISDALCNTKKKQCSYLNNSIRKYGREAFSIEVIEYCELENTNDREVAFIKEHNTIAPNGYNLCEGGMKGPTLLPQKVKLMNKTHEQFFQKKLERFKNVSKVDLTNLDYYIKERHHEGYGGTYYAVVIDGVKSIFVAQHLSKEDLKRQVYDFLTKLEKLQHDQTAGNP